MKRASLRAFLAGALGRESTLGGGGATALLLRAARRSVRQQRWRAPGCRRGVPRKTASVARLRLMQHAS
jgi:hypothetical protein